MALTGYTGTAFNVDIATVMAILANADESVDFKVRDAFFYDPITKKVRNDGIVISDASKSKVFTAGNYAAGHELNVTGGAPGTWIIDYVVSSTFVPPKYYIKGSFNVTITDIPLNALVGAQRGLWFNTADANGIVANSCDLKVYFNSAPSHQSCGIVVSGASEVLLLRAKKPSGSYVFAGGTIASAAVDCSSEAGVWVVEVYCSGMYGGYAQHPAVPAAFPAITYTLNGTESTVTIAGPGLRASYTLYSHPCAGSTVYTDTATYPVYEARLNFPSYVPIINFGNPYGGYTDGGGTFPSRTVIGQNFGGSAIGGTASWALRVTNVGGTTVDVASIIAVVSSISGC